ncbi:hypothetical protein F5883DRAFT_513040, partial [Diaporthe sp. PMI_573]
MTTSEPTTTIASVAELNLRSFQQCLHQAARLHPRELAMIEDQLARFSLWASGIGVFARGRASMDHRLREAPDIYDAVESLLEDLADSIQDCTVGSGDIESMVESQKEVTENTPTAADAKLESSFRAVAGEINLLYRLSNTIRRASKESQNLKVANSYRIRDNDGNDAEPLLQAIFASYICGRFPDMGDGLRQRLASAMVLRRKRILYRRSRYGNAPIRTNKTTPRPKMEAPQSQREAPVIFDLADEATGAAALVVGPTPAKSTVQSLAVSATTLAAADYKKASAPSVISATKTVALGNDEDLVFPSAPNGRIKVRYNDLEKQRREAHQAYIEKELRETHKLPRKEIAATVEQFLQQISEAEMKLQVALELDLTECHKAIPELICPYCLYALPSVSVSDGKKWKAHITNDLDAYVCLFDECDKPEELYRHSSDWLQHMRGHTLRWRCNAKSHGTQTFLTEDLYLEHMRNAHAGSFTEPQLRALSERNGRPLGPMFTLCPICGTEEGTGTMEAHIVGHLRSLALRSLPPYEDEGLGSCGEEKGTSGASRPVSRSTIKKDHERHITPTFDDFDRHRTWAFDLNGDAYAPWAEAEYRTYIVESAEDPESPFNRQSAPRTLPAFPTPPPDHLFSGDPSTLFVNGSLFDGVRIEDRQNYEWGFAIKRTEEPSQNLKNDPVLQSILDFKRRIKEAASGTTAIAEPKGSPSTTQSAAHDGQRQLLPLDYPQDEVEGSTVQEYLKIYREAGGDLEKILDMAKERHLEDKLDYWIRQTKSMMDRAKSVDHDSRDPSHSDEVLPRNTQFDEFVEREATIMGTETADEAALPFVSENKEGEKVHDQQQATHTSGVSQDQPSGSEKPTSSQDVGIARDANTQRLEKILSDTALRQLFHESLREAHCEKYLSFHIDVDQYIRQYRGAVRASYESPDR